MIQNDKYLVIPPRSLKEPNPAYARSTKATGMFRNTSADGLDLICLSHLRWDFVYQRPQHLLSRCAKNRRVFFVEEPIYVKDQVAQFDVSMRDDNLYVVVPRLPMGLSKEETDRAQQSIINELIAQKQINDYLLWYYTPMALSFTQHLKPVATVYDCMDELSAFRGAPGELPQREAEMFRRADIVFTGGTSLYEAKRSQHQNIHLFPSSIDAAHFGQARVIDTDPPDQSEIPRPRLGYFGVIDERMDIDLLSAIASLRPDWQFVMIGPVVKIDPADLPRHPNIHYLGGKNYKELPAYIAGWDVALMPFAHNPSTRFISPTKTPEYLAAGKPVVSTSIRDVVRLYGDKKLVRIADTPEAFVAAAEAALREDVGNADWLIRVDELLARNSWDWTWERMSQLIETAIGKRPATAASEARKAAAAHKAAGSDAESPVAAD